MASAASDTDRKPDSAPHLPASRSPKTNSPLAVMVTLTDTSKPSSNAQRLLKITRENPVIRLGRASKTQAKGRMAAENNALFDSPVMSRDHAELVADMEAKASPLCPATDD